MCSDLDVEYNIGETLEKPNTKYGLPIDHKPVFCESLYSGFLPILVTEIMCHIHKSLMSIINYSLSQGNFP